MINEQIVWWWFKVRDHARNVVTFPIHVAFTLGFGVVMLYELIKWKLWVSKNGRLDDWRRDHQ